VRHPDSLIKYLAKPITEPPKKTDAPKPTEFITYQVRLNFAHWNKFYNDRRFMHPNTRLEYLTTSLAIPAGVSLYSVDRLENEIDEIDLGTLSRDHTVTFNTKLTGEYGAGSTFNNTTTGKSTRATGNEASSEEPVYDAKGNVIGKVNTKNTGGNTGESTNTNNTIGSANAKVGGEVSYLNNETIKEAVAVKLRRLKTGFSFSDQKLVIAQRGRPLGDISYNTIVTVTLKVSNPGNVFSPNVFDFKTLFTDKGEPVKANDLVFSMRGINFVPCDVATDVTLTTKYEGAIRAAGNEEDNTGENALEYDDKVTFYKIKPTDGDNVQIGKTLFCKKVYSITALDKDSNRYILKMAAPNPQKLLLFSDDKPEVFLQWVLEQRDNPASANLKTTKFKMYFQKTSDRTKIHLVKDGLSPTEITALKSLNDIKLEITNR
jgi:hypothetical protein